VGRSQPMDAGPFEFTLGPVDTALDAWVSDLVVIASGGDEISDPLRAAAQVFKKEQRWGEASLQIALVNRSGTVVWFGGSAGGSEFDLRSRADAARLVQRVLGALPTR